MSSPIPFLGESTASRSIRVWSASSPPTVVSGCPSVPCCRSSWVLAGSSLPSHGLPSPELASHGRPKGSTYSRIPRCSPEKPFCLDSPTQPWPRRLVLSLGGAARGLGRRSCPLFDLERWGYPRSSATMQKQSW